MTENSNIGRLPSTRSLSIIVNIFWYMGWVAAFFLILIAAFVLISGNNIKYIGLPIEVSFENSDNLEPLKYLNRHSEVDIVAFENITVDVSDADYLGFTLFIPLVILFGYFWIVYEVKKFIGSVKKGSPFTRENSRRIRLIGFIVTVAGPIIGSLQYFYGIRYAYLIDIPGAEIEMNPDVYPVAIFVGLLIIVIGHIYDLGVNLQEESNLTV